MSDVTIKLKINGKAREVSTLARKSLADMLREDVNLTSVHLGCEQGVCGACTVLVDGLPVRSCLTLAAACEGVEIVTIEGLHGDDTARLKAEFSKENALQCGFCTAGMLLTGHELICRREEMTRDQICTAMSGNICRCTGYNGIVRAIQTANAQGMEAEHSGAVA